MLPTSCTVKPREVWRLLSPDKGMAHGTCPMALCAERCSELLVLPSTRLKTSKIGALSILAFTSGTSRGIQCWLKVSSLSQLCRGVGGDVEALWSFKQCYWDWAQKLVVCMRLWETLQCEGSRAITVFLCDQHIVIRCFGIVY